MADGRGDWVSDVFRPKFEFETVDDLLRKSEEGARVGGFSKDVKEVYNRVYWETKSPEKVVQEEANSAGNERTSADVDGCQEKQAVEGEQECLWNKKELALLRKFFQKVKLQNIKLTAMLESAQNESKKWKDQCLAAEESCELVKKSFGTLRNKYERLKVNYRALKEDVRSYHSRLKVTRHDLKELRMDNGNLAKELNSAKSEVNMMKFKQEQMEVSIQQRELEFDQIVEKLEFTLQQQHLLEIAALKREREVLKQEFEKEKRENTLNKNALEHLRKHFANLQIDDATACDKVLSVIDIDYINN